MIIENGLNSPFSMMVGQDLHRVIRKWCRSDNDKTVSPQNRKYIHFESKAID